MSDELDKLGKFLMQHFRDNAIFKLDSLASSTIKAPSLQQLQNEIALLDEAQKEILRQTCIEVIDTGSHDLLFALQESGENNEGIQILVDKKDASELSDGLQGELFSEDGWITKFSANS